MILILLEQEEMTIVNISTDKVGRRGEYTHLHIVLYSKLNQIFQFLLFLFVHGILILCEF